MHLKTVLFILGMVFSCLSSWWVTSSRYEIKLLNQEKAYTSAQTIIQEKHRETVALMNKTSETETKRFQDEIGLLNEKSKALEDINNDMSASIERLRDNEATLRTRIRTLPNEAIRDYALSASTAFREISEALREEQLAHQETSRKAEEYYFSWRALDQAWPVPK